MKTMFGGAGCASRSSRPEARAMVPNAAWRKSDRRVTHSGMSPPRAHYTPRRRLLRERRLEVVVGEAEIDDGVGERLAACEAVEEAHPAERGPFGHDGNREQALVVRHLCVGRAQAAEAALEIRKR